MDHVWYPRVIETKRFYLWIICPSFRGQSRSSNFERNCELRVGFKACSNRLMLITSYQCRPPICQGFPGVLDRTFTIKISFSSQVHHTTSSIKCDSVDSFRIKRNTSPSSSPHDYPSPRYSPSCGFQFKTQIFANIPNHASRIHMKNTQIKNQAATPAPLPKSHTSPTHNRKSPHTLTSSQP
jgi:hypothetical protein